MSLSLALLAALCCVPPVLQAQSQAAAAPVGEWTWMGGSKTVNQPGVYGKLRIPGIGNVPGGRTEAVSWTDASGNFWLFGGDGLDSAGVRGMLNDLWVLDASTREWTWMSGSNLLPNDVSNSGKLGVYGTLGVPDPANVPGGRSGSCSWIDKNGRLWLLGGGGYNSVGFASFLNDLWQFDPSTLEWTWVSGSKTTGENGLLPGSYGKLGVASPSNVPGGRTWATAWTDNNGILWLFGGMGYDAAGLWGMLNDLWAFDPSTREWTWFAGKSQLPGIGGGYPGSYGVSGQFASTNLPGGRMNAATWTDHSGDVWFFSGSGYPDNTGTCGPLNDLWEFRPTTRDWAWMGGSKLVGESGNYGAPGVAATGNLPGARIPAASSTGAGSIFWIFGGFGNDSTTAQGPLNDLWELEPGARQWIWMSGSSTLGPANGRSGVYGALGVSAPGNVPGGRRSALAWTDKNGNFWLFGGDGFDSAGANNALNDLWVFRTTASPLPAATPAFLPPAGSYAAPQTVSLPDTTPGATIYYTLDGSTPAITPTEKYTAPLTISQTTTVNAIAVATGYSNSAVASATYIIGQPAAAVPTFKPAAGTYGEAQAVTISSTAPKATIYYTTNGSTPTVNSAKYTAPVAVTASGTTIKAIAAATGYSISAVNSAAYTFVGSPQVLTGLGTPSPAASTVHSATFNATVNDFGVAAQVWFQWGVNASSLSNTTAKSALPASTAAQKLSVIVSGLKTKTVYYFQPVATTIGGTAYGAIQTVTTN
ncbi:MAG: chitobiase/beta-hexosaminidase C-terminal domain-containing protein [Terracidiphilus sp.]